MTRAWYGPLVIVLVLLACAAPARGDGPGQPVFGDEPRPAPAPEFCPAAPPTITRTPFDGVDNPPPNAFVEHCAEGGPPCVFYFSAGTLGLQRQRLGSGTIGFFETDTSGDSGTLPAAFGDSIRYDRLPASYHWGGVGTLGVQQGPHALEFSGFYIGQQTVRGSVADPQHIDMLFGLFPTPVGFEGNNNLFLQADQMSVFLTSRLASAELNYRYIMGPEFEWILGVRYIDQAETLGIFTDDDGLTAPGNPLLQATYESSVKNRLIGGQFGFEFNQFLLPGRFALGLSDKNVIGSNFVEAQNRLVRGDGLVLDLGHQSETQVGGAVELNLFATLWLNEHIRIRAGYQALWLFNFAQAHQQVNFDTTQSLTNIHHSDSVFYHGPRIELQIGF